MPVQDAFKDQHRTEFQHHEVSPSMNATLHVMSLMTWLLRCSGT
jgi:hypothetical protein